MDDGGDAAGQFLRQFQPFLQREGAQPPGSDIPQVRAMQQ